MPVLGLVPHVSSHDSDKADSMWIRWAGAKLQFQVRATLCIIEPARQESYWLACMHHSRNTVPSWQACTANALKVTPTLGAQELQVLAHEVLDLLGHLNEGRPLHRLLRLWRSCHAATAIKGGLRGHCASGRLHLQRKGSQWCVTNYQQPLHNAQIGPAQSLSS